MISKITIEKMEWEIRKRRYEAIRHAFEKIDDQCFKYENFKFDVPAHLSSMREKLRVNLVNAEKNLLRYEDQMIAGMERAKKKAIPRENLNPTHAKKDNEKNGGQSEGPTKELGF